MTEKRKWYWDNRKRVSYYIDEDGKRHETKEDVMGFNSLKPVVFPIHEEDADE